MSKKSGFVIAGAILFMVLLGTGCLGSGEQHPAAGAVAAQCTESLGPGQNITINEMQDNATICAPLNSSMIVELPDPTRMGGEVSMSASPGLQVIDEGLIVRYFDVNGTPLQAPSAGPSMVAYTHEWNVTMTGTGVQTLKGYADFPATGRPNPEEMFNLTVVVG